MRGAVWNTGARGAMLCVALIRFAPDQNAFSNHITESMRRLSLEPPRRHPSMDHSRRSAPPLPVIIIVDDDDAVLASLKFALEIEGFAVRTYSTWSDALDDA